MMDTKGNIAAVTLPKNISELYPSLRKHYKLRVSKGFFIIKDFRTSEITKIDKQTLLILSLLDGTVSYSELIDICEGILEVSEQEARELLNNLLERMSEFIEYGSSPCERNQMGSLKKMIKFRLRPWSYSQFREESPFNLTFVLTEKCNHRCNYCCKNCETGEPGGLSVSEWTNLIDEASELCVQEITFTGGEPALYSGFFDLVSYAVIKGIYPRILTNGTTLTCDDIKRLHEAGAEYVHFSLPAVTPEIYERVTGVCGTLPKAMHAIADFKKYKFYIRVKMVLTKENISDVGPVLDFCNKEGVDFVHLAPFILTPISRGGAELIPTATELQAAHKIAEDKAKCFNGRTKVGGPPSGDLQWKGPHDIVKCGGIKEGLTVLPNGNITFCEILCRDDDFIIGNVRKTRLSQIWNSDIPDRVFRISEHYVEEPCQNCEHLRECGTGCFMFSKLYNKNPWSVDPRCFRQNIPGNVFAQKQHSITL